MPFFQFTLVLKPAHTAEVLVLQFCPTLFVAVLEYVFGFNFSCCHSKSFLSYLKNLDEIKLLNYLHYNLATLLDYIQSIFLMKADPTINVFDGLLCAL
jgi:hypothetical protein